MKKVLLTTTALVMTAGVAAAEVSCQTSGTAQVAATAWRTQQTVQTTFWEHTLDFNASASAAADNGMTMSTSSTRFGQLDVDYTRRTVDAQNWYLTLIS